jgi:hypothetical protein
MQLHFSTQISREERVRQVHWDAAGSFSLLLFFSRCDLLFVATKPGGAHWGRKEGVKFIQESKGFHGLLGKCSN